MNMYIKRVKAEIAWHNRYPDIRVLPYWAKLLWAVLDVDERRNDQRSRLTNKIDRWFFKKYLEGKVSE